MSKKRFNELQILEILGNPNVAKCSEKSLTYSRDFKIRAVKQYQEEGYSPRMIFEMAGFDLSVIGKDRPDDRIHHWRKIYGLKGAGELMVETRGRSRGAGMGRPKIRGLTDTDKIKRMAIEIAYLKAENDFLAKLRAAKKR
jgi:hypothetical protein